MCSSTANLQCRDSTTTPPFHDDDADQEDPRTRLLPAKPLATPTRSNNSPLPSRASSTVSDNTVTHNEFTTTTNHSHSSRLLSTQWWSWLLYTIAYSAVITTPLLLYDALRLALFVVCLAPGFYQFIKYYFTCGNRQVERYSDSGWRHTVDIYGATHTNTTTNTTTTTQPPPPKPVIVFFTGGAWVIGYKMWGAFLAKALTPFGILVVVPDTPNYPMVTVPQMVDAAEVAIQWTMENVERLGGDPTRVVLVGQSAGGHLCSCVLLRKAIRQLMAASNTTTTITSFQPTDVAGFVSISAPNDILAMERNFLKHGLNHNFLQSLFGDNHANHNNNGSSSSSKPMMDAYDPQQMVQEYRQLLLQQQQQQQPSAHDNNNDRACASPTSFMDESNHTSYLPPMSIFHGTADQTVPYTVSQTFAHALRQANVTTEYVAYEGWSHTDPILEGIMQADHRFHADLYQRLLEWTQPSHDNPMPPHFDASIPECQALCPTVLVNMGRWCNPF